MSRASALQYRRLFDLALQTGPEAAAERVMLLRNLNDGAGSPAEGWGAWQDLLLFLLAYPSGAAEWKAVQKEIMRVVKQVKAEVRKDADAWRDSGLPFAHMLTRFSHDLLCWLKAQKSVRVSFDSFEEGNGSLAEILRCTLPAIEREECSTGLEGHELMDRLGVAPPQRLTFLLEQFASLNGSPLLKDKLWEELKVWVRIMPVAPVCSRLLNVLPVRKPFFDTQRLKQFDAGAWMAAPLPPELPPGKKAAEHLLSVVRFSLMLTLRETDPSTFADPASLRLFQLERGVSVALYGLKAERQLPLQSYVGYTLFRNGVPVAYGGAWIFGRTARFGLNVFEAFRGGESGFLMAQLLRVYRQVFSLQSVDVEPEQFGRDNPDGIRSGAFWFYYRYGFRPVDPTLRELAQREDRKRQKDPAYRSSERTLIRLAQSDLRLTWEKVLHPSYAHIQVRMTKLLHREGRNRNAEKAIREIQASWPSDVQSAAYSEELQTLLLLFRALKMPVLKNKQRIDELLAARQGDAAAYQFALADLMQSGVAKGKKEKLQEKIHHKKNDLIL